MNNFKLFKLNLALCINITYLIENEDISWPILKYIEVVLLVQGKRGVLHVCCVGWKHSAAHGRFNYFTLRIEKAWSTNYSVERWTQEREQSVLKMTGPYL